MRVWKFGNDVDTDAIIPGRYLTIYDPEELARHVFEGTRNDFANGVRPGDIIVAGSNFGSGSSREHAPLALKGAGVRVVIAQSFARIFFRNAINIGLLPLVCPDTSGIEDGETAAVDLDGSTLIVGGRSYALEPIPAFVRDIVRAGGLVPYARSLKEGVRCTVLQQ
ncbi:MAG: 3-isopropylmalate dehydratase small subunit [Methanomicrobiales archaeon]|nr:3-isopropylmalate dehydratase small subunit [Methanomicrobiales archaeon]MDI6875316.1 3-isopropylmalate dehydratase small subunit [Methanomicrobiales archaeon]